MKLCRINLFYFKCINLIWPLKCLNYFNTPNWHNLAGSHLCDEANIKMSHFLTRVNSDWLHVRNLSVAHCFKLHIRLLGQTTAMCTLQTFTKTSVTLQLATTLWPKAGVLVTKATTKKGGGKKTMADNQSVIGRCPVVGPKNG